VNPALSKQETGWPVPDLEHGPPLPHVPGYEILAELGHGGMGVVYKARHLKLNRLVALKMIQGGDLTRFSIEAETVARLQHPNIVQIHEIGEHHGLPFFSLEFCPGGSLDRKLEGHPLPFREAAELMRILALGMAAAHQAHVLHRDLKPANVLLTADGTPKITDFGLAKKLDEVGETRVGAVMGTPPYMAPEQAQGSKDIGPPADIYGLGATLYELLTGQPPFRGATTLDTLFQVVQNEPTAPRQLNRKVPKDLETICLKCLRKESGKRYAGAEDLAADLGRFLGGEPIRARPVGRLEQSWKWARRNPSLAGLLGMLVLGVVGLFGAALVVKNRQAAALQRKLDRRQRFDQRWNEGKEADAAGQVALAQGQDEEAGRRLTGAVSLYNQALEVLDGEPDLKEEFGEQLLEQRGRAERSLAAAADAQQRRRAGEKFRERVRQFPAKRDAIVAQEISLPGDASAETDRVGEQAREALALLPIAAPCRPEDARRTLEACRVHCASPAQFEQLAVGCHEVLLAWAEAEARARPGEPAERRAERARRAVELLDEGVALRQAVDTKPCRSEHIRRSRYLAQAGDRKGSFDEQSRAQALLPRTSADHFLLALDSYSRGERAQARQGCEQALLLEEEHFWAQYLLSLCDLQDRRWSDAELKLTVCLTRRPKFAWGQAFLASAEAQLQKFDLAEKNWGQALEELKDFGRALVLTNRGGVRVFRQHWDEAERDLKEAVELAPGLLQAHLHLAELHRLRKRRTEAVAEIDAALRLQPRNPALYHHRARLHLEEKDRTAARRDLEQAIDCEPAGSRTDRLASVRVELGHLKLEAGEPAAALKDFDVALEVKPGYQPAQQRRAEALLELGRDEEAGREMDRCLAAGRGGPEAYVTRGLIWVRQQRYPEAVEAYTQALVRKKDGETLKLRGRLYLRMQSPQPALADFDAAVRLNPRDGEAWCGRGQAQAALGQWLEAREDAEKASRQGADNPDLLVKIACIHAHVGARLRNAGSRRQPDDSTQDLDRAVDLLDRALRLVPWKERRDFWQKHIRGEAALTALNRNGKVDQLFKVHVR
jgi:tetratricopeptide (TPR) repeat protein/tRNA A-37 threonylcarbamoyl transferase component Bud32